MINEIYEKVINHGVIDRNDILVLKNIDIETLSLYANKIREYFCGSIFDVCSIINAKSGRCSENCKFCAQSRHYNTGVLEYDLLSADKILKSAKDNYNKGVKRFAVVSAGRKLNTYEIDKLCDIIKSIRQETGLLTCASIGFLSKDELIKLQKAGLNRLHNNLETSKEYFPKVCSTHSFDDKVSFIKLASSIGIDICSGGIIGIGETFEDRISMGFTLLDLDIKSIPLNILYPIKNTPFENMKPLSYDEILQTISIYRFMFPKAVIRYAGGRMTLSDKGKKGLKAGINGFITGTLLTTSGIDILEDMELIKSLGFKAGLL